MRSPTIVTLGLGLLVASSGCEEEPPPPPRSVPQVEDLPEPVEVPAPTYGQQRMHDRYDAVEALREAIVRGDLDIARAVARRMDRPVGVGHLPPSAHRLTDTVPPLATAVASASDEDLPRAFGQLLAACGRCHEAAAVRWRFDDHPPPADGDLDAHMARHEWAVRRMWEALVVGDDARFDEGARALEDAPLVGVAPDEEEPPGLSAIERSIHERARAAREATDRATRADIYGDVLASCTGCHAQIEAHDDAER